MTSLTGSRRIEIATERRADTIDIVATQPGCVVEGVWRQQQELRIPLILLCKEVKEVTR